jgi:hypothetical protein
MSADPILSEMQQLEERLLHTDFSSQPQQLDALLAPDFEEVSPIGQGTARAQVVQWLLQKNPAHRWQLSQWQVASLSDAVRLVRYHAVQSTPPSQSKGALHCSLWVYDNDTQRWRLRFHQSTKVVA